MLTFLDPSVRDVATLKHALSTASGTTVVAAQRAVQSARKTPEVQRLVVHSLVADAISTRFWADTPADRNRLVLFKSVLAEAFASPRVIGIFSDAFDGIDVSEQALQDFVANPQLRLSPDNALLVIIAACYATNEGNRGVARRVLQRRLSDVNESTVDTFIKQVGNDRVVRQLYAFTIADLNFQAFNKAVAAHTSVHGPGFVVPAQVDAKQSEECVVPLRSLLEDLGPACTSSVEEATTLLTLFPWPVTPAEVAGCLIVMMKGAPAKSDSAVWANVKTALRGPSGNNKKSTPQPAAPAWQPQILAEAVAEQHPEFDWTAVLAALDQPECEIEASVQKIQVILGAFRKATGQAPPISPFVAAPWQHAPAAQLNVLKFYATNPDVFDRSGQTSVTAELLPTTASASFSTAWHCPQFVAALLDCGAVGGSALFETVKQMILGAAKAAPAAVMAALLTCVPVRSTKTLRVAMHVLQSVGFALCMTPDTLAYVNSRSRHTLLLRLVTSYIAADHGRAASVLPLLQQHRLFQQVLAVATDPASHVLIAISGQECGQVPTNYIAEALASPATVNPALAFVKDMPVSRVALAMAAVEVCDDLISKGSSVSTAIRTALNAVVNSGLAPILPAVVSHAKSLLSASSAFGRPEDDAEPEKFPDAVETEAGALVEAACRTTDPTGESDLQRVLALKRSEKEADQQLLRCVCKTALEEAPCVSQYPPSALSNFSRFFGKLVASDVLVGKDLRIALSIILQSLVNPTDARIHDFAVNALLVFKGRLAEWPAFRRSLRQARDLDMHLPGIIAQLTAFDKSDAERTTPAPADNSAAVDVNSRANDAATNHGLHQHDIRALMPETASVAPSSVVQDRINFLVGNTDTDAEKTETHAAELRSLLRPEFYQYFADYLVVKRIALEPNNHRTYLGLIERLASPDLENKIRRATIQACRRLVASEVVCTNSSERSLLKSLGSWLGQITLAKNIPVLARDLDLRELVPNALKDGKLIAVVPFLAKVIEHSGNSRAFRVPNPFIMCLLGQLAEMYHLEDLKITLRFEVEVLCRNLHIQIADLLDFGAKDRPHRDPLDVLKREYVDVHNSFDFRPTHDESEAPRTRLREDAEPYEPRPPGSAGAASGPGSGPVVPGSAPVPENIGPVRQASGHPIQAFLTIRELNPGREINQIHPHNHPQYRAMLQNALDQGLMETVPILERSASVGAGTTREIVAKDFSRDRDDRAFSLAAHAMARGLATQLAGVMARENALACIRRNLSTQLARVFQQDSVPEVVENLVNENTAGILQALEEATTELTARAVDTDLVRQCEERSQAWRTGERQFPREVVSPSVAKALSEMPERLRPAGALLPVHHAVYQEYIPVRPDSSVEHIIQLLQVIEEAALRHYTECPPSANQANVLSLTNVTFTETRQSEHHEIIKKKLVEVNHWITDQNAVPLLLHLFPRIMILAEKVQSEARGPPGSVTHANLLLNEVCLFVLQAIREKAKDKAVAELTKLYAAHEKRWANKDLATNLIRLRVIDVAEFDRVLTRALQDPAPFPKQQAVEFAGHIVQKCLIEDKLATVKDLKNTLEMLEKIAEVSKRQRAPTRVRVPTSDPSLENRDDIAKYFAEWMQICEKRSSTTTAATTPTATAAAPGGAPGSPTGSTDGMASGGASSAAAGAGQQSKQIVALAFVRKLQETGMLKAETMLDRFFSTLTELAVEDYATQLAAYERTLTPEQRQAQEKGPEISRGSVQPPPARMPGDPKVFSAIDAFSDLVVVLVKCCAWSNTRRDTTEAARQGAAETALVTRVMHVVARCLQFNHDYAVNPEQHAEGAAQPGLPEGHVLQTEHLQQPFLRFFSNLMLSLAPQQGDTGEQRVEYFSSMANIYHAINPQRLPGFAFAWIELICHRVFVSKLMRQQSNWPLYFKLLNDALRFVEPFARPGQMTPPLILYFKCVMKLLLMLLHDFAEFLLMYHQPLCDAIPMCCVQMRNIVLSAFPRATRLPDPFSRAKRFNVLPEMREGPSIVVTVANPFAQQFNGVACPIPKADFDRYLENKQPADLPSRVVRAVTARKDAPTYNVPMLSGLILYAGIQTLHRQQAALTEEFKKEEPNPDPLVFSPDMPVAELLRYILSEFNSEGRYHVVNACVNQLRFPNSHTHFFSLALQHLFANPCPHQEALQEGITRVLVERLIISRPHPWGLLITFFDIVKEPSNHFWDKPFIRCTPEIERMFESVAQSVQPQARQQQQQQQQQTPTTAHPPQQQGPPGSAASPPASPAGVAPSGR